MALSTQPYKGARDFYPEEKRLQKYMFGVMRSVVERFGYLEYDAPIIEPLEIYAAKTGEEIVNEQTYRFTDRGGREVVIRPEMTPSVSRMVATKRQELAYPLRWYSIPNLWRYERPQRGRLREHWQLNVDLFGEEDLKAEREIINVADAIMQAYGAKRDQYTIKLNSRALMKTLIHDYLSLSEVQTATFSKLLDKMHKMDHSEFMAQAEALLTPSQREAGVSQKLVDLLGTKTLDQLPHNPKTIEPTNNLNSLFMWLKEDGITNIEFDISLMRGFDYYTGVVFEVFDNHPENNRSMFGGGRYDGLVGLFGVEPVPTVGFGMGDVTLQNFLIGNNLVPKLKTETDLYIGLIGDVYAPAQKVIKELREMGVKVAADLGGNKVDKQIKTALKNGINYMLFIGEKELADGQFTLKDLSTGKEEKHALQRIVSIVKDYRKK